MTITLEDFYSGRDIIYPDDLTDEVKANAVITVEKANQLLAIFGLDRKCNSGWRPKTVQMQVNPKAPNSKHITGQAIDIEDSDGSLKKSIKENETVLEQLDVYMESPTATRTWVHIQIVPPGSGHRIFIP